MASGNLRAELECSICLNIYTDPVTLKCGHNFCRDCIGHVLDTQEGTGGYSCPECRDKFQERPALQRNKTLRNIVENFLSAQPDQEESGVLCTHCVHTPVPAVKSCLMCEASLCDNHLRIHSKAPEHVLCDLTTSLENRKCSIHKMILEYYCAEDSACICVSCRLDGEHRGHQVETLDEASEKKKKKKLRNVLQKLMTEREETEKRVQSLEEHRRKVQGKAADETERVLGEISGQAERTSLYVTDMIRELEIKKDELSRKMRHIEELCNTTDLLTVLQESLDVAGISHTLHTGISDIMSGVNVQEGPGTHVYPHSSTQDKGHMTAEPSRPRTQPTPTVKHSQLQAGGHNIGAVQQTSGVSGVTDILLDVNTAGNNLLISDDRKTATWSDIDQNRPETPERFQYSQVLSSQSFSSGRHYWEVDVGGSVLWRVGMCYPSIERRGGQSWIGDKKSWGLGRLGSRYSVRHDSNQMPLRGKLSSNRVRIDLDYEAGRISFYDLCDPIRLLHTFTTTFTEPLHAGLCKDRHPQAGTSSSNHLIIPSGRAEKTLSLVAMIIIRNIFSFHCAVYGRPRSPPNSVPHEEVEVAVPLQCRAASEETGPQQWWRRLRKEEVGGESTAACRHTLGQRWGLGWEERAADTGFQSPPPLPAACVPTARRVNGGVCLESHCL
ncbi:PREDICTED: E3 ubiquitin/ISG15 ligase TRIM25-like [Nanorana parkeri]|uniref:E3 ubiquitin/ISG15 ligase TRIM25-like n=1 Tax=Nanorana parkeri TaxID=125878 RepID=UPI0008546A77|nr:PREDICTED: E3 ubiquitin/ISG15 ligase TRIM25-like [Nanorana parkeri]